MVCVTCMAMSCANICGHSCPFVIRSQNPCKWPCLNRTWVSLNCAQLCITELNWTELSVIKINWIEWTWMSWPDLIVLELNWSEMNQTKLNLTKLNWTALDWSESKLTELNGVIELNKQNKTGLRVIEQYSSRAASVSKSLHQCYVPKELTLCAWGNIWLSE